MSMRTETMYFVHCDTCGVEHNDPDVRSAMAARISAGVQGWRFESGRQLQPKPGLKGRRAWDFCPTCPSQYPDA